MVLSVPAANWNEFEHLCRSEGVEATVIGKFTDTRQLVVKFHDHEVGRLDMHFSHDGRPPVIRDAVYASPAQQPLAAAPVDKGDSPSGPYRLAAEESLVGKGQSPFSTGFADALHKILG